MFAEEPQSIIKRCGIKIYRYKTNNEEGSRETLDESIKTIDGWIYKQIKSSVTETVKIVESISKLGDAGLEKISYPFDALHEIITNAVLHRDYNIPNDVHIRIFDNRIEVESPGKLPGHVTINNILQETWSRNGNLVRLINKFPNPPNKDIGEGLRTAFQAMRKLRLKDPIMKEFDNKFIVYLYHEPLASPEEIILNHLENNISIQKSTAREICHVTYDNEIEQIIKRLVNRNLIEPIPGLKGRAFAYRKKVKPEPFDYDLKLRSYQIEAIMKFEKSYLNGRKQTLISMAPGTGRTNTFIILIYRLIKIYKFRKIIYILSGQMFVNQVLHKLNNTDIENFKSFAEIFEVEEITNNLNNSSAQINIITAQAFQNFYDSTDNKTKQSILAQYDCIFMDDCYNINYENLVKLLSKCNNIKIYSTTKGTSELIEIFGQPIYTYSYRQAVINGWLVDCEFIPVPMEGVPDKLQLKELNKNFINEEYIRLICKELSKYINPQLIEKTLIFCESEIQADIVSQQLKVSLTEQYSIHDITIINFTNSADNIQQLVNQFQDDANMKIAISNEFLADGIDIPAICNLVFLGQFNSIVTLEQILGRATHRCDEINKKVLRVYDCVNLFDSIELWDIKPVGVNPNISFAQILAKLETTTDEKNSKELLNQLVAKLQNKQRVLNDSNREDIERIMQISFEEIITNLTSSNYFQADEWLRSRTDAIKTLDPSINLDVSNVEESQGYLDKFRSFLLKNNDNIQALQLVIQQPSRLTKSQLVQLKSMLDSVGYQEKSLQAAWEETNNEYVAASIIDFIRWAVTGSTLVSHIERVDKAMRKIMEMQSWAPPQRKWLERIGKQLKLETIVDREALDQGEFKAQGGGFQRLNKTFNGELENILIQINEELWKDVR